jgi:hypothetical protein
MDPLVRKIRQNLEQLVDLCIENKPPFAALTPMSPFNWFVKRVADADQKEKEALWKAFRITTKWKISGIDDLSEEVSAAFDRLDIFNREWLRGHLPLPKNRHLLNMSPRDVIKIIWDIKNRDLPEWQRFHSEDVGSSCFSLDVANKCKFLIMFDVRSNGFDVDFGLSEPFFVMPIGCFWGLSQTRWFFNTESECFFSLNQAFHVVKTISPLVVQNIECAIKEFSAN